MKLLVLIGLVVWSAVAYAKDDTVTRPKGTGSVAEQMRARDAATAKKLKPQPRPAADKERDAKIKARGDWAAKHPNLPAR